MSNVLKNNITKVIGLAAAMLVMFFSIVLVAQALTPQERAALEAQLQQLEAEIAEKEAVLDSQKNTSQSLENEVRKLQSQINTARSKINYHDKQISAISGDINEKQKTIVTLDQKIDRSKKSLAELLRKTNEVDKKPLLHGLLAKNTLSEFYLDGDNFLAIKDSLQASVIEIEGAKVETAQVKEQLERKKVEEEAAKKEIERQRQLVEQSKRDQDRLLNASKDKEKEYEELIKDRQAEVSRIKARLFELRDSVAIQFGDAVIYAKEAEAKTGVKAAAILAILTQESALGKNVGQCLMTNTPNIGDGVGKNTGNPISRVMKPTRDVEPFLRITAALGLDFARTPVSCPLSVGYGGAMGPSQFIPSTWEWIEPKIASLLGVSTPDPWNPQHAVMATAKYIEILGGATSDRYEMREAFCKYYSGVSCFHPTVRNMFYGNSVLNIMDRLQPDIDLITG